jgi:hypothetical protein
MSNYNRYDWSYTSNAQSSWSAKDVKTLQIISKIIFENPLIFILNGKSMIKYTSDNKCVWDL